MQNKLLVISILILSGVLLLGTAALAMKFSASPAIEVTTKANASMQETSKDWGVISMKNGNVTAEFPITNTGTEPLKLFGVKTSCTCTTAQLLMNATSSPIFTMHGKSSYILEVPPQQTATLRAIFDPNFHGPNGVGAISREVTVRTNDAQKPELKFLLSAQVVP